MGQNNFNVGLVGAGTIAHGHVQAFKSIPNSDVLAVAEIKEERLKKFQKKYDIDVAVKDYHKLLEMDELDALVLCVPNYLHAPMAVDGMKAGKHILSEKPMGINLKAAKKMVETQIETEKTLMVSLQARYTDSIQLAKKYAENQLGDKYYGRCGYLRRSGIPGWGSWFTQKEKSGGGPCADIGVHVLDMCLFIMGYPRPVSVTASTYDKFGSQGFGKGGWGEQDPDGCFDVEDLALAFIRFEDGSTVILEASWALNRPDQQWVEVMGTDSGIVYNGREISIHTDEFNTPIEINPGQRGGGNVSSGRMTMSRHFIECCQTGKEPDTSGKYGLILNAIFDAVYQSAENGGTQVEVNL